MAKIHGKNAEFELNSVDLSAFISSTGFNRSADSHDTTTYGNDAHVFSGGLLNGTIDIEGFYDDGAAGPRATIEPLIGTVVTFAWRPEGTGATKPESTGSVLVTGYAETGPAADMIGWTATLQITGDVTDADQV